MDESGTAAGAGVLVMAIIPGKFCERCAEDVDIPVPAEYEMDSCGEGSGGGGFLCDNCATNMAEAQHERMLEAYYGGSSPQTILEQCEAADKQRRELRSKD